MKDETTFQYNNGTWYLRIPPSFARHLELNQDEEQEGWIQDEKGQHGKYCSFWKNGK